MKQSIINLIQTSVNQAVLVGRLTWLEVLLALAVAIICGSIIYWVYRKFFRGVIYDDNFNLLLLLVTLITAFVIMAISSNLVLSLGMVGALSIIRFRTAVKDALDTGFIFWAVAAGVTAGAGLYLIALLGTIVIALVYIGSGWLKPGARRFLVIAKYQPQADKEVQNLLEREKNWSLKGKTQTDTRIELTISVRAESQIDTTLKKLKGVDSVTKVEYNGNYLG